MTYFADLPKKKMSFKLSDKIMNKGFTKYINIPAKDVKEFIRLIKKTKGIGKQWENQIDKLAGEELIKNKVVGK